MMIRELVVNNYKSLRGVCIKPGEFGVIVGPNAAGKSNLADCIDFLSEVYRHGLELAVARRGGYENIAHRKQRRSKSAIGFQITVEFTSATRPVARAIRTRARENELRAHHVFAIRASGESLRAPFKVVHERLSLEVREGGEWRHLMTYDRQNEDVSLASIMNKSTDLELLQASDEIRREVLGQYAVEFMGRGDLHAEPTELLAMELRGIVRPLRDLHNALGSIRVFQLSPNSSREFGVPTPGAELAREGGNLPAAVDLLQRRFPDQWARVLGAMTMVVPGLESIEVGYSRSRTLELLFQERSYGRPWTSGEVSDGTIQTLALMVAIHDPRATALVLEEPENSVHPWIIRHVLDACIEASKARQVLVTTHSPVVMNHVSPEQVWLMWRRRGVSRVARLAERDPMVVKMWGEGQISTFDYLDSGALGEAVPPPAEPDLQLELEELDVPPKPRGSRGEDQEP